MTRIVLVEDDAALRYDLSERLVQLGYDVFSAPNGELGFDAIQDFQPDVVLSDINMPIQTGYDLMRRVKQLGVDYADVVFMFISARAAPQMVIDGLYAGADDYLTKPIDYTLLKAKLEAHLRKRDHMHDLFSRLLWRIRS